MASSRKLLHRTERGHPFPWVIISQEVDDWGLPVFSRHTLAESAQSEAAALVYAERRAQEGCWVTVYREHHYYAPPRTKDT